MSEFNENEQKALEAAALFFQEIPNYLTQDGKKEKLQYRLLDVISALDIVEYYRSGESFIDSVRNESSYRFKVGVFVLTRDFGLTEKESQVLQLLMCRKNAQEIADTLVVSIATARTHMYSVYRKLGVHSFAELEEFTQSYVGTRYSHAVIPHELLADK